MDNISPALRDAVRKIMSDTSLTPAQRTRQMQNVLNGRDASDSPASQVAPSRGVSGTVDLAAPQPVPERGRRVFVRSSKEPLGAEAEMAWYAAAAEARAADAGPSTLQDLGCVHYSRSVRYACSRCGHWTTCRLCHSADSPAVASSATARRAGAASSLSSSASFSSSSQSLSPASSSRSNSADSALSDSGTRSGGSAMSVSVAASPSTPTPPDSGGCSTFDRFSTSHMYCMACDSPAQPMARSCVHCGTPGGTYFCSICRFHTNLGPGKHIFHCDDCGLCRVGQGLGIDFFHCDTCKCCLAIGLQGAHECRPAVLEAECPVCHDPLHDSLATVMFLQGCGHPVHSRCASRWAAQSYQCPVCQRSLGDMSTAWQQLDMLLAEQPMPPEYRDATATISCRDCGDRSTVPYHFLAHRCSGCSSYNTALLSVSGLPEGAGDAATHGASLLTE